MIDLCALRVRSSRDLPSILEHLELGFRRCSSHALLLLSYVPIFRYGDECGDGGRAHSSVDAVADQRHTLRGGHL